MRQRESIGNESGWFTSSYSGAGATECVEAAFLVGRTAVRDSKEADGPVLTFAAEAWDAFLRGVRAHCGRDRGSLC